MPLLIIIGVAAALAGAAGIGAGVHGAVKMKEANDTMDLANKRHKRNMEKLEGKNKFALEQMDKLGKKELEIIKSFDEFSNVFEKIQNKPEFASYNKEGISIPKYNPQELKQASIGAGILLGGLGGAALGTAGGFAAAGATTAAVMALGTASTGTAIATLSGAAATNATLAALGGGALAAGGGGMALGATILGGATLGVGLLVGGVIFSITGNSLSEKADEAWAKMREAEKEIEKICFYLDDLSNTADKFYNALYKVDTIYKHHLNYLKHAIYDLKKTNWINFTLEEKIWTENTVLLVSILYSMVKTKLVLKSNNEKELNKINKEETERLISDSNRALIEKGLM
mgnify:FL=1